MSFFTLAVIFIVCGLVRTAYECLSPDDLQESPLLLKVMVGVTMFGFWVSWFRMCSVDNASLGVPEYLRWGGFGVFVAGLVFFIGGLMQLIIAHRNHAGIVTNGFFSVIRHPMYLGFLFWLIGFPLYRDAGTSLWLALPGMAMVFLWGYFEERRLAAKNTTYRDYRDRTLF